MRHIEVALNGRLVNPFEIYESTFRELDEADMTNLFREYAEGLLETFGEYHRR